MSTTTPAPTSNAFDMGELKFEALGDRLIIQEDEFKTGYECTTCNGETKVMCDGCGGFGTRGVKKCSDCSGEGKVTCPNCKGKGGIIIAPEVSQRRPTSGTIVSAGPGKTEMGKLIPMQLKVGQSVLYSNFAGYVIDLNRAGKNITLRILHESEILCRLEGHLTMTNLRGKTDIATFNN